MRDPRRVRRVRAGGGRRARREPRRRGVAREVQVEVRPAVHVARRHRPRGRRGLRRLGREVDDGQEVHGRHPQPLRDRRAGQDRQHRRGRRARAARRLPRERPRPDGHSRPDRRPWPRDGPGLRADARGPGPGRRSPAGRGDAVASPRPPPRGALRARLPRRRLRAPEPDRLLVLHPLRNGPGRARLDVLRRADPLRPLPAAGRAARPPPRARQHHGVLAPGLERAADRGGAGALGRARGHPAAGPAPALPDGRPHPPELPHAGGA